MSRGREVAEEEANQIERDRLEELSKAKKRTKFLKVGFLSAVVIAIALLIWSPGNQANSMFLAHWY